MSTTTIELDFTGCTPVGAGIAYLETGLHTGKIVEFKHFAESNRLYVYMMTGGLRHRDSFSLSEKAMPFLMGFLVSAGVPETKLSGKINFPFDKLNGRTIHFNYTAPQMGANGTPVDGSYPDYRYVNEAYYTQMKKATESSAPSDFKVEAPKQAAPVSNGKVANVAAVPTDDEFEFLMA
tara:strand:- start:3 stop:539 length:537 start_codon:yes stop_codon:yes gene_type:complete